MNQNIKINLLIFMTVGAFVFFTLFILYTERINDARFRVIEEKISSSKTTEIQTQETFSGKLQKIVKEKIQNQALVNDDMSELFTLSYSKENNQVKCENCGGELDDKYDLTWVVETEAGNSLLQRNAEGQSNRFGTKTIKCNDYYGVGNYIYLKSFSRNSHKSGYKRVSNIIECSKFVLR